MNRFDHNIPHHGALRLNDFKDDFRFMSFDVSENIAQYVKYIWIIRWNFSDDKPHSSPAILPGPEFNIFFSKEAHGVQSIFNTNTSYVVSGSGCIAGVTFKPAGFFAYSDRKLSDYVNHALPLPPKFDMVSDDFVSRLLRLDDTEITTKLHEVLSSINVQYSPKINQSQEIVAAIQGDATLNSVRMVAEHFNVSERYLQGLFSECIGVGVKWVILRQRLMDALASIRSHDELDWSAISSDLGYSSQAHFITDFKKSCGLTPTQFVRNYAE